MEYWIRQNLLEHHALTCSDGGDCVEDDRGDIRWRRGTQQAGITINARAVKFPLKQVIACGVVKTGVWFTGVNLNITEAPCESRGAQTGEVFKRFCCACSVVGTWV